MEAKCAGQSGVAQVARETAHSIEFADQEDSSKWGLRVGRDDDLMLKVVFVEVFQAGDDWFHLLLDKANISMRLKTDRHFRFNNNEPYKNAPGCITCDVEMSFAVRAYDALLLVHEAAIRVATRSRRHTSTKRDRSPRFISLCPSRSVAHSRSPHSCLHRARAHVVGSAHFARELGAGRERAGNTSVARRYHRNTFARLVVWRGLGLGCASSVAVVLLVMSLLYSNFITVPAAFALVLGANMGSAINPLVEGSGLKDQRNRLHLAKREAGLGPSVTIPSVIRSVRSSPLLRAYWMSGYGGRGRAVMPGQYDQVAV